MLQSQRWRLDNSQENSNIKFPTNSHKSLKLLCGLIKTTGKGTDLNILATDCIQSELCEHCAHLKSQFRNDDEKKQQKSFQNCFVCSHFPIRKKRKYFNLLFSVGLLIFFLVVIFLCNKSYKRI